MSGGAAPRAPLAELMRPRTVDEVVGQDHLLGPGQPLRLAFDSGTLHSMILWGPPGVGKTSLARVMAQAFDTEFIAVSAVLAGVKEIRAARDEAERSLEETGRRTVLFVDEIHRFNRSQQDALLPYVESGLLTFIGATTENPSFEVNGALLSRAQVYVLRSLTDTDLHHLLARACTRIRPNGSWDDDARGEIVARADGDGRRLLNLVEQVLGALSAEPGRSVDTALIASALAPGLRRFDKAGDYFYDQISALHKSVRGSHPDAALYWLCRMLDGGADPRYLARRLVRMAWEDVGLADPRALQIAGEAAATYERLGSPEGELALAQAVLYLAVAAKSNAGYRAYQQAREFVAQDRSREVPAHLRNAPTSLTQELGHGQGYRYAHDEPDAYAEGLGYLPVDMVEPRWYQPVERGLESKIREKLASLRARDEAAKTDARDCATRPQSVD